MPLVFMFFALLGFIILVRYDSPKFYLYSANKESTAKKVIHKMYDTNGSDYIANQIIF